MRMPRPLSRHRGERREPYEGIAAGLITRHRPQIVIPAVPAIAGATVDAAPIRRCLVGDQDLDGCAQPLFHVTAEAMIDHARARSHLKDAEARP